MPSVPRPRVTPSSTAFAVPVALVVVLVVALAVGLLLRGRAGSSGLAAIPDTGPALVGTPLPPEGSGPPTVTLAPTAASHPRANEIRGLFQRSVDARNARDFDTWSSTVASGADEKSFARETRSQRVGSVVVRRVDPVGAGEIVVLANLVTTQDPADAPPDIRVPRLCWQVSMVVLAGSPARLTDPRPGSALRTPC